MEMAFLYPNGSMIEMGYCDTDQDADNYRGSEWDVLFIDEGTELSEYQYGVLVSCVRGVNNFPKRTYVTCNPGGVGHDNIKRLFITRNDYHRSEDPKDYTFIQAHVWDNVPLMMADPGFVKAWKEYRKKNKIKTITPNPEELKNLMMFSEYVKALDNLPDEVRKAYLAGDWDIFSGKFFTEWNPEVHITTEETIVERLRKDKYENKELPRHWRRSASIDFGLDRFAALWFAIDERGQSYCYRSYEESNLIASSAAAMYKELSRYPDGTTENIERVIAPPDLWNRRNDTGKSVAEIFYEAGIPLTEAGRERAAGWVQVKEYLKYEREKNETGKYRVTKPPRLLFLDTCVWIIKFIPACQYNVKKPNDVMTEPHYVTHSPDALRAWCSVYHSETIIPPAPKVYNFECEKPKTEGWGGEVTEEYLTGGYGS
jgi:phage terminase large subunit